MRLSIASGCDGALAIWRAHRRLVLPGLLALAALLPPARAESPAKAPAEVILRLKGGGFELRGALRAFDGQRYVLETAQHGRMTLNAARYECVGEACAAPPRSASPDYDRLYAERAETATILAGDSAGSLLLPALVRGYAEAAGMEAAPVVGGNRDRREWRLIDDGAQRLGAFEISRAGSADGIQTILDGKASFVLSGRRATTEESRAAAAAKARFPGGRNEQQIAVDGIAVVVGPQNPLHHIGLEALARVLTGDVADWYDLGQAPGAIAVYLAEEGSSAAARAAAELVAAKRSALKPGMIRRATEAAVAEAVAGDPRGIGLVSMAAVHAVRALNLETSCGLLLKPTPFAVKSGEYPLSVPIHLHALMPPKEAPARGLLRFLATPAAHEIVERSGFMSGVPSAIGVTEQAERMAHATNAQGDAFDLGLMRQMLSDLKDWKRLSVTFRPAAGTLATGTRDADPRTRAEAERLAALLLTPDWKGRKVMLAGFTDADGGKLQANLTHSTKRAAQLRALLTGLGGAALDGRRIVIKGYGPLAPVACNDTAEGRALNRRVEVWVSSD